MTHNEEQLKVFLGIYTGKLAEAVERSPDKYCYPVSEVPQVVERMRVAILRGSYSLHSSPAFKATCKALGIKFTYKAVREYLAITAEPVAA